MPQPMTIRQASSEFGVPLRTLTNWTQEGQMRCVRKNGRVYVTERDILKRLETYTPTWMNRRYQIIENLSVLGMEQTISPSEASERTGIDRRAIAKYLRSGKLVGRKVIVESQTAQAIYLRDYRRRQGRTNRPDFSYEIKVKDLIAFLRQGEQ